MRSARSFRLPRIWELASRRAWMIAAVIFAAALLVRVAFVWGHGIGVTADTSVYAAAARNLSHGIFSIDDKAVRSTTRIPPLYPVLLGAIGWPNHLPNAVVVAIQITFDSLLAAALYLAVGASMGRWRIGLLPGLGWAFYPAALLDASRVLSETTFTLLLTAGAIMIATALASDRLRRSAVGGALIGAAALCRSSAMLLPLALAAVAVAAPCPGRRRLGHAGLIVGSAAVVMLPWAIRCSRAAGTFVPVQSSGGVNVYIPTRTDWNQSDQGEIWKRFATDPCGRVIADAQTPAELAAADKTCIALARERIRSSPWAYLRSRARAVPHLVFSSFDFIPGAHASFTELRAGRAWGCLLWKATLLFVFSVLPLVLAAVGLIIARRVPLVLVASAVWIYGVLFHAPLWIEPRFFWPFVPCLLIAAGFGALARREPALGSSPTVSLKLPA